MYTAQAFSCGGKLSVEEEGIFCGRVPLELLVLDVIFAQLHWLACLSELTSPQPLLV